MILMLYVLVAVAATASATLLSPTHLWGPYRTGNYIGIRSALPDSLQAGLMWYNADLWQGLHQTRDQCSADDRLGSGGFGWQDYDPRTGGVEVVDDLEENHVVITAEFVKLESGQRWGLRVKGNTTAPGDTTTVVFYTGLDMTDVVDYAKNKDHQMDFLELKGGTRWEGFAPGTLLELVGVSGALGGAVLIEITDPISNNRPAVVGLAHPELDPRNTHHLPMHFPGNQIHQAKDMVWTMVKESLGELLEQVKDLYEHTPPASALTLRNPHRFPLGNLHFVQKTFVGDFEFDVVFNNRVAWDKPITPESMGTRVKSAVDYFRRRFSEAFPGKAHLPTIRPLFANLLGSLGVFHGTRLVDRSPDLEDESFKPLRLHNSADEGPSLLFAFTPLRRDAPWGDYWDEGFHLVLVMEYDWELAAVVMHSWLDQMDNDGWIAREQVLGEELQLRAPLGAQVQTPLIASPPTLVLAVQRLVERHRMSQFDEHAARAANETTAEEHLQRLYPKLQQHFEWFSRSQRGIYDEFGRDELLDGSAQVFRWRGRTKNHCASSGMEDYPRAQPPDTAEVHVDLMLWMAWMARTMGDVAEVAGRADEVRRYRLVHRELVTNIDRLHWNDKAGVYCDTLVDDEEEEEQTCRVGYVLLFPFLTMVLPEEPGPLNRRLAGVVAAMRDPDVLWSAHGLRSLLARDPMYGRGNKRWTGPVWVELNYMALRAMQHYHGAAGVSEETQQQLAEAYRELRANVVATVVGAGAYVRYNSTTGAGIGTRGPHGGALLAAVLASMPSTLP